MPVIASVRIRVVSDHDQNVICFNHARRVAHFLRTAKIVDLIGVKVLDAAVKINGCPGVLLKVC